MHDDNTEHEHEKELKIKKVFDKPTETVEEETTVKETKKKED